MTIMSKRGKLDNVVTYEHICDTVTDMQKINPKYITLGSACIVLTGASGGMEVYLANSQKQWGIITAGGSGGGDTGSFSIQVLTSSDVDANGLPNIANPQSNTFYFVPTNEESPNMYKKYIYVNGHWESFSGNNTTPAQADWLQLNTTAPDYIKHSPVKQKYVLSDTLLIFGTGEPAQEDEIQELKEKYNTDNVDIQIYWQNSDRITIPELGKLYRIVYLNQTFIRPCVYIYPSPNSQSTTPLLGFVLDSENYENPTGYLPNNNLIVYYKGSTANTKQTYGLVITGQPTEQILDMQASYITYADDIEQLSFIMENTESYYVIDSTYIPLPIKKMGYFSGFDNLTIGAQDSYTSVTYNNIEYTSNDGQVMGCGSIRLGFSGGLVGGYGAISAGIGNSAMGDGAFATGIGTTAASISAHSQGMMTTANGQYSHAEGHETSARGNGSHAEGYGTIATSAYQHVFGTFNVEEQLPEDSTDAKGTYVEIIGNGINNNLRSNARTLDWNGNETIAGNLTANGGSLRLGNTVLSENQLQALLALLS